MTEQQHREQIMKARSAQSQQPTQTRDDIPLSNEELAALQSSQDGSAPPTREQALIAAMLGKTIQHGLNDIKKNAIGNTLKVNDVDMSKVMPSGIMAAMGQKPLLVPPQQPSPQQPPPVNPGLNPIVPIGPAPTSWKKLESVDDNLSSPLMSIVNKTAENDSIEQSEFNFNRQAKYEDIMQAVEKLEDKVIMLTELIKELQQVVDKKKPKKTITNPLDGTQTG